ncbi:MAG: restriction endonuclease subunit S [Fusobacterium gastrosuis]|uniref:restriction endonuclease subunit S n=1 Tax=Fusobacterium gastrosuis TaxID=1755100 RepID=UPI002A8BECB1|nr:restriction endonuclease subunit S [Fusobacterium gastrosuis]
MSKLRLGDIEWGIFKIRNIFMIEKVIGRPIENYSIGNTPYISNASTNNAVVSFVDDINSVSKGNTISVDPIKGSCFYHEYDFIGRGFSGASVNLLRSDKLNKYNAVFCCSAIQKTSMAKASYGYLFNSDRLKNGTIMLPIDSKGNPNWQFMEDYVKQEMREQAKKIVKYYENKLLKLAFEVLDLEVEWKEFFFTDIFKEIKRGKRLTKGNQIDGDTPYVSSTGFNNGVDNFIGNEKGVRRYNNNLSLANSGTVGSCFYHNYEYVASDHITALTTEYANEYVYKFMSTIIKRLEEKYSFNREINDKRISREKIFLPIDKNGNPHWEYMSNFMKKLEKESIEKVLEYIYIYIYIY